MRASARPVPDAPPATQVPAGPVRRVGWGFVVLYTLAYMGTCLVLIAPITVTLALKVNLLVGTERAPDHLALVVGVGALMAVVGTPLFGRLSDAPPRGGECVGRGW
jgi:MFS family permease